MAHGGLHDGDAGRATPPPDHGWKPSRSFKLGLFGLAFFVAVLAIAGFVGATRDPETSADSTSQGSSLPAGHVAGGATSLDGQDGDSSLTPSPVVAGVAVTPLLPTPTQPGGTAVPIATDPPSTASSVASTPAPTVGTAATIAPTIGEGLTATPAPTTPQPAGDLAPEAEALAVQIETRHGVRIVRAGQEWGDDQVEQLRNLSAIAAGLEAIPPAVRSAIADNEGGVLSFLTNNFGRTEDGWQPYGNRAANYYTNEDNGPNGERPANQVVLQPGSTSQTIAHEMIHAFQLRDVAPGEYVQALLTAEMKSFMAATGWRQTVSDDEVRANANQSWERINQYFVYEGRDLRYLNEYGDVTVLYSPNPLEAYAEAAGLYYAHSFAMELPDWPEYWSWFDSSLGPAVQ